MEKQREACTIVRGFVIFDPVQKVVCSCSCLFGAAMFLSREGEKEKASD